MIDSGYHFSISRYGDGEMVVMDGKKIDITRKANGEFRYDPEVKKDEESRQMLIDSFKYRSDNYFVGIGCRCCVGDNNFMKMKDLSGQYEENLTWANIFVNSNYEHVKNDLIPLLSKKKVVMVAHAMADISGLPFDVVKTFRCLPNAFTRSIELVDEIKDWIKDNDVKDHVFVMCAGPLACILAHKLHEFNKENTYIDFGSGLDVMMSLGKTRGYLAGDHYLTKTCVW